MTRKNHSRAVLAVLTLGLIACEGSITSVSDPDIALEVPASTGLGQGSCVAPAADLISWWPGDGDFADLVGTNPVSGTVGVSFEPGVVDEAFRFHGLPGHYIQIADSNVLRPAAFTVDLWAERFGPGLGTSNNDIYGNMLVQKAITDNSLDGSFFSYFISWRGDGTIAAGVYFDNDPGGAGAPVRIVTTESFPNNTPVFIALSVDGPAVTLYVNGAVKGTFDATGLGSVAYGTGSMVIGNNWQEGRRLGYHRTPDGTVDEVELFGRALPIGEIQAIYDAGPAGKCKDGNEAPVVPVVEVVVGEIDEGGTLDASVSFADDASHSWTATVDYGDGDGDVFSGTNENFDVSHTFAQDGEYTVTVAVTDDAGYEGHGYANVVVNNVAPTVDVGSDAQILEGDTWVSGGSFTDPGADSWTATVDYGDGSGSQPLTLVGKSFELSHTYVGNGSGPFTVTVTVEDDDASGVGTALVTVAPYHCDGECHDDDYDDDYDDDDEDDENDDDDGDDDDDDDDDHS